jgi:hypothetical protein
MLKLKKHSLYCDVDQHHSRYVPSSLATISQKMSPATSLSVSWSY